MAYPRLMTLTIALLLSVGCGNSSDAPPLGNVSGTVVIDGEPKGNVIVTFTPDEGGRPSTATTDRYGKYSLAYSTTETGALLGTHTVTIRSLVLDYDSSTPEGKSRASSSESDAPIPKAYSMATQQVTVKAGRNTIDIVYPSR